MLKASTLLVSLAFALGCIGLWFFLGVIANIYQYRLGNRTQSNLERLCFWSRLWLPYLPLPFLMFSIFRFFRPRPTTEFVLLYAASLAVLFTFIFFTIAVGVSAGWLTIKGPMGG